MKKQDLSITINKLKESPLFNLSLSSSELFHSNFLYWVANNYKKEFGEMFAPYLKEVPSDLTIHNVYREKKNIDLSFSYQNGQEVFIENNVKSVPYIQQLVRYSNNNPNHNYILLSLSRPLFFDDLDIHGRELDYKEIEGVKWHYISYEVLKVKLQSILVEINEHDEYHSKIITDYCNFIQSLIEVKEFCKLKNYEKFDFYSKENNEVYKELENIRLHDFYLKKKYEFLAFEVYKRLKNKGVRHRLISFGTPLDWESDSPIIYFSSGMTNTQGLMDLKYLISERVALGIQIQGDQYRMVVEDRNEVTANSIKEILHEKGLWFNFSKNFGSSIKVYPIIRNKGFNKFGKAFFYKSVKLHRSTTIDEVVNFILSDFENIELNYDDIREITTAVH